MRFVTPYPGTRLGILCALTEGLLWQKCTHRPHGTVTAKGKPMSTPNTTRGTSTARSSTVQTVARIVGIVFLLVGILGFIPGITTNYETLMIAGHESEALLLGLFQVSILHNIVHFLYGVAGVLLARTFDGARNYLIWGGVVYLVLWLFGLFIPHDQPINFVPLNGADNWLHLFLGIGMIALGLIFGRRDRTRTT